MRNLQKKEIIRVVATVLTVAIALTMLLALPACKTEQEPEKKGIVICTALLSGSLMYEDTGEPLWDPLTEQVLDLGAIVNDEGEFDIQFDKLGNAISNLLKNKDFFARLFATENGVLDDLTLDADGNSIGKLVPCTLDSEYCQKYGVFACYQELYESLKEAYAVIGEDGTEEYEVTVFNYDWRLDIRTNGALLEQYIQSHDYDKVVLTAHSMGGNVVANYLARSESNRNKVEAFVSFGSPYFGSAMAVDLFENIQYFGSYADDILESPAGVLLTGMDLKTIIEDKVVPMAKSWTSLYQLMPWPELLTDGNGKGGFKLKVDGKYITTADELYDFYESRYWAKDENGNVIKAVKELRDYHNSCYVNVNGQKVFSTTLVNSYYVSGDKVSTISEMIYVGGEYDDWETDDIGDGTVPINSSGRTLNAEKTTICDGVGHIPLGLFDKYTLEPIATAMASTKK